MLSFSGEASAGQYSVMLMAEDILPQSGLSSNQEPKPLSSVPVYLSLTGELCGLTAIEGPTHLLHSVYSPMQTLYGLSGKMRIYVPDFTWSTD